jgi:hypothetical protein
VTDCPKGGGIIANDWHAALASFPSHDQSADYSGISDDSKLSTFFAGVIYPDGNVFWFLPINADLGWHFTYREQAFMLQILPSWPQRRERNKS